MSMPLPDGLSWPACAECGYAVTETHWLTGGGVLIAGIPAVVHRKCFTASLVRLEAQMVTP